MKLYIENIGKISKATIDLNGITLIAGENNTGKSTIGKVLFSYFNSFYKIDEVVESQLYSSISNKIISVCSNHILSKTHMDSDMMHYRMMVRRRTTIIPKNIRSFLEKLISQKYNEKSITTDFLGLCLNNTILDSIDSIDDVSNEVLEYTKNLLVNADSFSSLLNRFKPSRINDYFSTVFDDQIVNIESDIGSIRTIIKNSNNSIEFHKNGIAYSTEISINNRAIYIDSPSEFKITASDWNIGSHKHSPFYEKNVFSYYDSDDVDEDTETSYVEKTLVKEKLDEVWNVLNKAFKGHFVKADSKSGISFLFEGMGSAISVGNLSTGVKSLLLLRSIIENELLSDKDVLILDEPEIHIHPEWQLIYAEAIVLLQKKFNLTILVTSHSPVFIRAIECYCDYYDCMKNLDVYKTFKCNEFSYTLKNLSYSEFGVSELYEDYMEPYRKLDELIEKKHGENDD